MGSALLRAWYRKKLWMQEVRIVGPEADHWAKRHFATEAFDPNDPDGPVWHPTKFQVFSYRTFSFFRILPF